MKEYYIVYKKKILHGPMSKKAAIVKLFELSNTFKGLRVRTYFGKKKPSLAPQDEDDKKPGDDQFSSDN
jgi:hypothetical protein